MKKVLALFLCLIFAFVTVGCSKNDNTNSSFTESVIENNKYSDHQELTSEQVNFDKDKMLRLSISEIGLENVFVQEFFNSERICAEGYGEVYLLADDRYGGGLSPVDIYLVIVFDNEVFVKDLSKCGVTASYFADMELRDVDGNPDVEIILNICVSMTGGTGNHISFVFDFKDGEIIEMFSSIDESENHIDTGYSITILKDKKFMIKNEITGYSEIFNDIRELPDEYYINNWYNLKNDEIKDIDLWVDSFYEFSSIDIDNDGVYEILCRQYTCLVDHADSLGNAKTLYKYNIEKQSFEIYSTEFENNKF